MTLSDTPHEPIDTMLEPSSDSDLGTIFRIFRRRAWVFALWMLIMLAMGIFVVLLMPTKYEATTVVQVVQDERPALNSDVAPEAIATAPEILKTFEGNLDNGALLLRVFKINKLDQDPRYLAEQAIPIRRLKKWISRILSGESGPPGDAALIREMDKRAIVKLRRGTRLIDVSARAQDPALAVQLSQSLVNEYIRLNFDQKVNAAKPTYEYWLREADQLKDRLQKSEQLLQNYKEDQHAVSLEASQNIVVETLKALNALLSEARSARIKLDVDYARLRASEGRPNELLSLKGIATSPDVMALKERIAELEAKLSSLGQRYTSRSPKYLQSESELTKLKQSLESGIQDAAGIIRASYDSARDSEDKLLAALQEQEKHALDLNRIALQYNVLSRDVASDRAQYDAVLKQLKETQIIQGVEQGGIRIVEPATLPDKPVWKTKIIVLAIALSFGGVLGIGAAVGPVLYKAPLLTATDAERQLGIPALGVIPKARGRRGPQNIFLLDNPRAPASEAIRSLRAMLLLKTRSAKGNIVLFTSALTGEGKTFCAINSAAALAIDGRRTLLIDANLRSPSVGSQLLGRQPVGGLTDVLSGQAEFESAVRPAKVENLFVLAAGSPTDKPSETLGSPKMVELLAIASASYDYIIVDSAPVLEASDALRIVIHSCLICLIARSDKTPGRAVTRTLHLLTSAEMTPPAGVVLNCADSAIDS